MKHILDDMDAQCLQASFDTYATLLHGCINMKSLAQGKKVHAHIIKSRLKPSTFVGNMLINMYAKCGSVMGARQVFDKMPQRDVVSWTLMIAGYADHGLGRAALVLFWEMQSTGMKPDRAIFLSILKVCANLKSLEQGKHIHAYIIECDFESDVFVGNTLVDMYAKCGCTEYARKVFDKMPKRDVVSWNVMISGYTRQKGHGVEALCLFWEMHLEGVKPNFVTFVSILKACSSPTDLLHGKEIHAYIIDSGFESDVFVGSTLIDMYAKCGSIEYARQVFDKLPRQNLVLWNVMLAGYARHGCAEQALKLFGQMQVECVKPDRVSIVSILKTCASLKSLEILKQIHAHIIEGGFDSDVFVGNTLIDTYAKCRKTVDAHKVFDKMTKRNVVSWTALVAGYSLEGNGDEALRLFWQMLQEGMNPDEVTFVSILRICASLGSLEHGKQIHLEIIKREFDLDVSVGNALVDMYAKCGNIGLARQVFDKMHKRDVVSWTAMITGYTQQVHGKEALKLFWQMQQETVKPDSVTFVSLVKACASLASQEQGKQIHAYIIKSGLESDVFVGSTLIDMYVKCGSIKHARQVFDKMPKRNLVSWNSMIAGYAQHGHGEEALKLFPQMQADNVMPDQVTFVSILKACASLAALEQGKFIHSCIVKSGFELDLSVGNGLIDMYSKCGSIEHSRQVFNKMANRNVVSWNAIVSGYAQHGHSEETLKLIDAMQQEGEMLDHITFISLLSACGHTGLVDEGHYYFDSMIKDYGIIPAAEHYACMVGLLGRSGYLDETMDFVKKVPFEPSAVIWWALLGACKIDSNTELAKHVVECILELEPQSVAAFVQLSNMYAMSSRWDDRASVRKMMEDRAVKKKPGCAWIEVNKWLHSFVSDDTSHPQMKEIHAELKRLSLQMAEAGYVPDTRFVLHDVEQEKKESSLCYHSEKLAIAFGLISTLAGTKIHIIKNLRVCGDCHTAAKFISKIASREIIEQCRNLVNAWKLFDRWLIKMWSKYMETMGMVRMLQSSFGNARGNVKQDQVIFFCILEVYANVKPWNRVKHTHTCSMKVGLSQMSLWAPYF